MFWPAQDGRRKVIYDISTRFLQAVAIELIACANLSLLLKLICVYCTPFSTHLAKQKDYLSWQDRNNNVISCKYLLSEECRPCHCVQLPSARCAPSTDSKHAWSSRLAHRIPPYTPQRPSLAFWVAVCHVWVELCLSEQAPAARRVYVE